MLFTNKQLKQLIIPLVIEQLLAILVGLADTIMVARVGEAAVSGISLVDTVFVLLIMVFVALSTGGAVVAGQYIGQGKPERASETADQLILFVMVCSVVITSIVYIGRDGILRLLFGQIDQEVMSNAKRYLMITAASIPFLAIYNGGAAIFRAEGNSKVSMKTSMLMNGINVVGNAALIYGLKMGVEGAAIPTLVSRVVAALIIVTLLKNPDLQVHISPKMVWKFDKDKIKKILHLAVPNSLENGIFHMGKILVLSLVSTFGTASIAANAVSNTVAGFQILPAQAMNVAILTVVSQCIGAADYEQVRYYVRKLFQWIYMADIAVGIGIFLALPFILKAYNLSPETATIARRILTYHGVMAICFWPLSFSVPNILRAANDVRFTMWVAILSMWSCRIGLSYIIGKYMGLGVFGVWVAMTIDWLVRSACFIYRYRSGKWKNVK